MFCTSAEFSGLPSHADCQRRDEGGRAGWEECTWAANTVRLGGVGLQATAAEDEATSVHTKAGDGSGCFMIIYCQRTLYSIYIYTDNALSAALVLYCILYFYCIVLVLLDWPVIQNYKLLVG